MATQYTKSADMWQDLPLAGTKPKVLKLIESDAKLANNVAEKIEAMGFEKLKYLRHGESSLYFQSETEDGTKSLVKICPASDAYIPCPLLVPYLQKMEVCASNGEIINVCVVPALSRTVSQEERDSVYDLLSRCGLKETLLGELNRNNIRMCNYVNPRGEHASIPMIVDWGSVEILHGQDTARLKLKWDKDPDLSHWRDAQAFLKQQSHKREV